MKTNLKGPHILESNPTLYSVDLVASCTPRSFLPSMVLHATHDISSPSKTSSASSWDAATSCHESSWVVPMVAAVVAIIRVKEQELEAVQHSSDSKRGEHRQTRHCAQPELVTCQVVAGEIEGVTRW
jgi:hypothetical protein